MNNTSPALQILFVHGMGRSPLSALPLLRACRAAGFGTATFSYFTAAQDFESIRSRLTGRLAELARQGPYAVIGHSLGGVLLRAALAELPAGSALPHHVFLLGSPVQSPRLARRLQGQWLYRQLTGDCGQLLASPERMRLVAPAPAPSTCIIGTRGVQGRHSPFGQEANDGVVAATEVHAPWVEASIELPVIHTLLPASRRVTGLVLQTLLPGT